MSLTTNCKLLCLFASYGLFTFLMATRLVAQASPAFQFKPDRHATIALEDVPIAAGIPEGFDTRELVSQIGGERPQEWLTEHCLTGWFSYGDTRSHSVVVLLTQQTPRQLFVDLNRNRVLEPDEQIAAATDDPLRWVVDLDAEYIIPDDKPFWQRQQIQIRFSPDSKTMRLTTTGQMRGQVEFAGAQRMGYYVDRNHNGRWFDAEDRLFIDFNGDNRIDPLLERLPCLGTRQIAGELYAIRGEATGRHLELAPVRERGNLIPVLKMSDSTAEVVSVSGSLVSVSGMQVSIQAIDQPLEVPVGTWYVGELKLTVRSATGTYVFDLESLNPRANPATVENQTDIEIDLLGSLSLSASYSDLRNSEGLTRIVTPILRTQSGLYLTNARSGSDFLVEENRLIARSYFQGSAFHTGSTGFT